jgi:transmembrane sensor
MGQANDKIDAEAALWAAKVASGSLTPEEQRCLDHWRALDIRHAGAFSRAQAILLRMDRLRAIGADALRGAIPAEPPELASGEPLLDGPLSHGEETVAKPRTPTWTRRRAVLAGTTAATLAIAGVLEGTAIWNRRPPKANVEPVERFATRMGETRSVRLADGSIVTLNTSSEISVRYSTVARNIRLERGEALFDVAKNKFRPFVVVASDAVIRAVGTRFTVRALPERPIQVLVQEGVVEVSHPHKSSEKPVRAAAETQTVIAANAPIAIRTIPRAQVERNVAWQRGLISFENETLADAAQEFGRYSGTKIAVDPAVANRTITGMFAANDPVGFAKVAATVLDLHIEVESNEVWIVR